jgi:hypothetical protein
MYVDQGVLFGATLTGTWHIHTSQRCINTTRRGAGNTVRHHVNTVHCAGEFYTASRSATRHACFIECGARCAVHCALFSLCGGLRLLGAAAVERPLGAFALRRAITRHRHCPPAPRPTQDRSPWLLARPLFSNSPPKAEADVALFGLWEYEDKREPKSEVWQCQQLMINQAPTPF